MFGACAEQFDITAGDGSGGGERAGFDAVSNHGVVAAMQFFDAGDGDFVGADTFDLCAHGLQAMRQIAYFRLARGIVQHGYAVGDTRSHQEIFGGAYRYFFKMDVRAF